jgi:hypothetical protein
MSGWPSEQNYEMDTQGADKEPPSIPLLITRTPIPRQIVTQNAVPSMKELGSDNEIAGHF